MRRYREQKVRSIGELKKLIDALELDEGIRLQGKSKDFKDGGFIFITKSRGKYCVNFCDKVKDKALRAYVPGGREEFHYLSRAEEVWSLVNGKFATPLKAAIY
ncbi:MAG: hypothetical protein HY619_07035 [Thaumarchaeota archaeon]|nr:hypothetical protein [Nitrososphaerota archaeon]